MLRSRRARPRLAERCAGPAEQRAQPSARDRSMSRRLVGRLAGVACSASKDAAGRHPIWARRGPPWNGVRITAASHRYPAAPHRSSRSPRRPEPFTVCGMAEIRPAATSPASRSSCSRRRPTSRACLRRPRDHGTRWVGWTWSESEDGSAVRTYQRILWSTIVGARPTERGEVRCDVSPWSYWWLGW